MDKEKQKERTKMILLEKLKNLKIKSQGAPSVVSVSSNPRSISNAPNQQYVYTNLIKTSKEQKKVFANEIVFENEEKKMVNEDDKDTNKQSKRSVRVKRPYYEHYSKEGVFQPILEYVRNHPNPSGKPPNIPPQMYAGIQVIPKRPWVFFGPENIPPSDCQQINQKTFSVIFQQAKKMKGSGAFKKSNKKKGNKKTEDQISEVSQEFTSNFTFSDSVDLSKQSDLISQFRTQTKTLKAYDSSHPEESYVSDDFSSVSGSVTQRQRYNLFDSSQSQEKSESSGQATRRRKKFKKLLESSDEEPSKNSMFKPNSFQGSSGGINMGSSGNGGSGNQNISQKGSSAKVEVDEGESSFSKSKSRSKSKMVIQKSKRPNTRLKKMKKEQEDSD